MGTHDIQPDEAGTSSYIGRALYLEVIGSRADLTLGDYNGDGAVWFFSNPDVFGDEDPVESAAWKAPCGCNGLGSQPITAVSMQTKSVTLLFEVYPDGSPCVAEPVV